MRHDKKRFIKRSLQVFISSFLAVAVIGAVVFVTQGREIPVLNPSGTIAQQQYILILITVGLGIFVIVPVFILLFAVAWRYRASNKKAKYDPELEGSRVLEIIWWTIPCLIILALAVITYISTHALDPYKALESDKIPVKVQVIATEWNWLFIYPEQGTATLNYMNIPEDTPINIEVTSDAPMNTFWVPALAGQVYAMSGMSSKLHLMADNPGTYNGSTTNISGEGYASLRFKVYSMKEADFMAWSKQAASSADALTNNSYAEISDYTASKPEMTYMLMAPSLYNDVIMKYMHAEKQTESTKKEDETQHDAHSEAHSHHEGMSH